MKKMLKWFNVLGVCLFLVACSTTTSTRDDKASESTSQAKTNENNNTTQADNTVTIRAIGDILLHDFVYDTALTGTGEYSFDSMFEPVKPYIENADITIANLETIAAGDTMALSSYPFFNAPSEIIDTLKNIGVDIVNNTSNHTMDLGPTGALESLKALKARKID